VASVTLNKIAKVYPNGFKAVHDIDFKINDGEFVVLVGPSGCAKSTLLRMVAGLESITSGELTIGDKVVNRAPPKDRGAAMVFQNYALYPHMKVRENLAFGLKLQGLPKDEVAKPQVFLFDEPLSNLDAKLRASMRVRITELHQQLKAAGLPCTVIYVTHDQVEAMTMGERICVLKEGRIQQFDTPSMLYNQPANTFVASFIGSPEMNILDAHLSVNGQDRTVTLLGGSSRLPETKLSVHGTELPIKLGLRPENVLVNLSDEKDVLWIDCEISHIEYMGSEVFAYFRVGDASITSRLPASQATLVSSLKRGEKAHIGLQLLHSHLFDAETGVNLNSTH
jgi:oligogalacturonide transport system ATP-binding protein